MNRVIQLTKFNKIVLVIVLLAGSVFTTYQLTVSSFDHQFRVIYNLDKKQNDQEIIRVINSADKYIYFAVFTFTKDNIADALIRAKRRGVIVWGITDTKQATNEYEKPVIQRLVSAGIRVETQKHSDGIMHIKAVVTDKGYAVGSYNWTEAATVANDELLEIGTNQFLRKQYLDIIKRTLVNNQ